MNGVSSCALSFFTVIDAAPSFAPRRSRQRPRPSIRCAPRRALAAFLVCIALVGGAHADALSVVRPGSGSGGVTADAGAIDCGAVCSGDYAAGTPITLTAFPAAGSQFTGWQGPCSGTGTCQFPGKPTFSAQAGRRR